MMCFTKTAAPGLIGFRGTMFFVDAITLIACNVVQLNLVLRIVIPAKAGIQRRNSLKTQDPCLRRDYT
jgi:hypothetical protein